jgi:hypothetical protein
MTEINELGDIIPDDIIKIAKEKGCISSRYIYIDGKYPNKGPAASVGSYKATRFGNRYNAENNKMFVKEQWVIFRSPSSPKDNKSNSQIISSRNTENQNYNYKPESCAKAKKHTEILSKVYEIFKKKIPECNVYLTVYRTGKIKHLYNKAEKESRCTFYHLKIYDTSFGNRNIKDPDAIVAILDTVNYVIEVKWGYITEYPTERSDMLSIFNEKEQQEIIEMTTMPTTNCIIKGPYVKNGQDMHGNETIKVKLDKNTKYIVVSDIKSIYQRNPTLLNIIKKMHLPYKNLYSICDIAYDVDNYKSLENFIDENTP